GGTCRRPSEGRETGNGAPLEGPSTTRQRAGECREKTRRPGTRRSVSAAHRMGTEAGGLARTTDLARGRGEEAQRARAPVPDGRALGRGTVDADGTSSPVASPPGRQG